MKKILIFIGMTHLIFLSACTTTNLIQKGEDRNIITNLMNKSDVLEIMGEPSKALSLEGTLSYAKEGCPGHRLEVLQYETVKADQFVLFVINQNGFVCKKLFKNQKAVWN